MNFTVDQVTEAKALLAKLSLAMSTTLSAPEIAPHETAITWAARVEDDTLALFGVKANTGAALVGRGLLQQLTGETDQHVRHHRFTTLGLAARDILLRGAEAVLAEAYANAQNIDPTEENLVQAAEVADQISDEMKAALLDADLGPGGKQLQALDTTLPATRWELEQQGLTREGGWLTTLGVWARQVLLARLPLSQAYFSESLNPEELSSWSVEDLRRELAEIQRHLENKLRFGYTQTQVAKLSQYRIRLEQEIMARVITEDLDVESAADDKPAAPAQIRDMVEGERIVDFAAGTASAPFEEVAEPLFVEPMFSSRVGVISDRVKSRRRAHNRVARRSRRINRQRRR